MTTYKDLSGPLGLECCDEVTLEALDPGETQGP